MVHSCYTRTENQCIISKGVIYVGFSIPVLFLTTKGLDAVGRITKLLVSPLTPVSPFLSCYNNSSDTGTQR